MHRLLALAALGLMVTHLRASEPPAQDQEPDAEPSEVLRGPEVDERAVPGVSDTFAPGTGDPRMARDRVPLRLYRTVLREMSSPGAPAGARLSPEQQARVREIGREYQREVQAFRREALGGKKLEDLDPQERRGLMRDAPRPDRFYGEVWGELDEAQREYLERRIAEEIGRAREERMMRDAPAPEAVGGRGASIDAADSARIDRLAKRLGALPPRVRDRVLSRMEDLVERAESAGSRGEPSERPAPRMDEVDVPPPLTD